MHHPKHAILAVLAIGFWLTATPASAQPIRVEFRLADGVKMTGDLTEWDGRGFDGTFGRRLWTELLPSDAWRVFRRVMDTKSATDWLDLARIMLLSPGGEEFAKRAFRQAERVDPDIRGRIEEVRTEAEAAKQQQEEAERAEQRGLLYTDSPEARDWPAEAWPVLSAAEQDAATNSVAADAKQILEQSGLSIRPVKTEHFLLYTDLPRSQAAAWAMDLERLYARLAATFALSSEDNVFWGRAAVFIFAEQDRFRLIEASAFQQFVALETTGMTHYSGPKVYIHLHRVKDDEDLKAALHRQVTLGFLHCHRTPRRLPPWAHEGFAEYVAQHVYEDSVFSDGLRPTAIEFIRSGARIADVFEMTRDAESWPGPRNVGPAVGSLFTGFLIERNRPAFVEWINDVKDGQEWAPALENRFGMTGQQMLAAFVRFYRVND